VSRDEFGLNMSDDEIRNCLNVMERKGGKAGPHPFFAWYGTKPQTSGVGHKLRFRRVAGRVRISQHANIAPTEKISRMLLKNSG